MRFPAILADPPWQFEIWSDHAVATSRNGPARKAMSASRFPTGKYAPDGNGRLPSAHYCVQGTDWIASLPVADVAADDCALFLWSVWPMLPEALRVIAAWGFEYKTLGFDWVKKTSCNLPRINLGYWTRANSEPCLLATRGTPKRLDKGVAQVIVTGLGEHSEKPEAQYERIERLVAGPYLELFARPHWGMLGPRQGWTHLGNEVTGRDMADDLRELAAAVECQPLLDVTAPEPAPRAEQIAMEVD